MEWTDSTVTAAMINGDSDKLKTAEMAEDEDIPMIKLSVQSLPGKATVADIRTFLDLKKTPFLEKTRSMMEQKVKERLCSNWHNL